MKFTLLAALLLCLGSIAGRAEEPVKIAFVDTGNTGRSVTAEALARAMIREKKLPIVVIGRGVDMDPFVLAPEDNAAALLMEHGIDVSHHRAQQLTPNDVKHADLILTMTAKHKATIVGLYPEAQAKTFTLAEYTTGQSTDVVDAYGKPMDIYEKVFAQISDYLPTALQKAAKK